MRTEIMALLGAGLLIASIPLTAQTDETDKQDTIIVTGLRLPTDLGQSGSTVTVIEADEIEALGFTHLGEVLATAPGVSFNQNGGFGGTASLRIRGASSEQTLVLVDGVPVNDATSPGGGFDFARLESGMIEKVEILRGAQSTLWGSDAIGGVVSITTKARKGISGGTAFGEVGSYETLRGGASHTWSNKDESYFRAAISGLTSAGISKADEKNGNTEEDGMDGYTLSLGGGAKLGENAKLSASLLHNKSEFEFDSFVFGAQGNVGDGDEESRTRETTAQAALEWNGFKGHLTNQLQLGYSDIDRQNYTNGVAGFGAEGERQAYRYQGTLDFNDHHRMALGAELEKLEVGNDDSVSKSVFALYELKPTQNTTFNIGLRHDGDDRYDSETTARASMHHAISDKLALRASWGQGFKAPTLFQTTFFCCGATGPNPNLKAETSEGGDIGIDYTSSVTQISATLFSQEVENLITFSFGLGGYDNIDMAEMQGLEFAADHAFSDQWSLGAAYTYTNAEDGAGAQLIRVPEHKGDIILSHSTTLKSSRTLTTTLLAKFNGEELDSTGKLDAWSRLDVNFSYGVTETLEAYMRIENLLDNDYQQLLGYGTPGLSGAVGFRLKY